jgi:hypothetical protein
MSDERPDEHGRTHILTEKLMRKLRGDERRGISYASIGGAVGLVVSLVGLGGVAMQAGAQKEKINQLEKRDVETRVLIDSKAKDLKTDIAKTDDKVDKILEAMGEIKGELRAARAARRVQR